MLRCILNKLHGLKPVPKGWVDVERHGLQWHLCMNNYIDRTIVLEGAFEKRTCERVFQEIQPGKVVLDVGGNIGYFTTIFAHLVGPQGKVYVFEPVPEYRKRLVHHVRLNHLEDRVALHEFGLSDQECDLEITIGDSSATIHEVDASKRRGLETIRLRPFDAVAEELALDRLDFIKIDVDGHEPYFFEGAKESIARFRPVILAEFSELNLDRAGFSVIEQGRQLEELGYVLVSEKTWKPFTSRTEFLIACGNCAFSANVWAYPRDRFPQWADAAPVCDAIPSPRRPGAANAKALAGGKA